MSAPTGSIVITRRFRGPPESANGGYACGLLGMHIPSGARVRLQHPPPLDVPLTIASDHEALALRHGETIIAEGSTDHLHGEIPAPVTFESATAAALGYRWFAGHPFPGCFVCGPERQGGDGLRIFPGRVADRTVVAAPWIPDSTVCDSSGHVHPEVLWAALDCPSWFGVLEFEQGATTALLGQLTATIRRRPAAGDRCVAIGWTRGREGRKLYGGAALHADEGELLGHSEAVWVAPRS
jgi:hypothetical protein